MEHKRWIWCLICERCFEVHLSREPEPGELPILFTPDIEMQLGQIQGDAVYAECAYDDCTASLLSFRWWDEVRLENSKLPELPTDGMFYRRPDIIA